LLYSCTKFETVIRLNPFPARLAPTSRDRVVTQREDER
jgi:hypothetical protein